MKKNIRIVHASVPGARHLAENIPCQDSHIVATTTGGLVLAVISDGAGSAKSSDIGSAFITKNALQIFGNLINKKNWFVDGNLPTNAEWKIQSTRMLRDLHHRLAGYATAIDKPLKDLLGTCIVFASNGKDGALVTHIGDGRATVRNTEGQWSSALKPCNGDQPNATMFIGVDIWSDSKKVNRWTESWVIKTPVTGFAMMSDGCEDLFYKTRVFDESGEEVDLNDPVQDNLEFNYNTLLNSEDESTINSVFKEFLLNSEQLKDEPDDKTMVLGTFEFGSVIKSVLSVEESLTKEQAETPNDGSGKMEKTVQSPKDDVALEPEDKNKILGVVAEQLNDQPEPGSNDSLVKNDREVESEGEKEVVEQGRKDCHLTEETKISHPEKVKGISIIQFLLKIIIP